MTPDERELRRALEARSGEPSTQFHARLTAAFGQGRPSSGLMQAVAIVAVIAITLGTVSVLVMSRNAREMSHQGPASASRLSAPTAIPIPIALSAYAQLSAPSSDAMWALFVTGVLYRTTDQGKTWEPHGQPWGQARADAISFVSDREGWVLAHLYAGTHCRVEGAEVWHTTDAGATWARVSSEVEALPKDAMRPTAQPPASGSPAIAHAQCKEYLYFVDSTRGFLTAWGDDHRPTIYRTVDGGRTWSGSALPDPPDFKTSPGGFPLRAGVFKRFGNTLYVEAWGSQSGNMPGRQYLFRSTNGGSTWSWLAKLPSMYIAMVTESRWLQLLVPGHSMETTDSGQHWHPYASDFTTDTAAGGPQVVFADSQVGYAEGRGAFQLTVDGGKHWERIATPRQYTPATPAPSGTPSQVGLLPITDPGFMCRLPVRSYSNGGFVAVPRGTFQPDPAASMVTTYQWIETSAKPVLKGSEGGLAFDAAFSRWIPASPVAISEDGSQYAWIEPQAGTPPYLLHVTRVADGSDRRFDAGPPRPRDPDLKGPAWIPVPIGITTDSVFLTYGWEGFYGVFRVDMANGSLNKVSVMNSPSYGAGAVWLELTRGPNHVGMYSDGDTLARLDLKSGVVQDWFHRDNFVVRNRGFDLEGNPWVETISFDNGEPMVFQIWKVRGPGQADLVLSSQLGSAVMADRHGTWFANGNGVYLYGGGRLQRVSAAPVDEVVGPCI